MRNDCISINIIGVNAAGILNKIDSFDSWLTDKCPSIFSIQETKVPIKGQIHSDVIDFYQLYEHIRTNNPGQGGGLCIGVTRDLHSTLIRDGGDEVECITVQVEVDNQSLVIVSGYGPQESRSSPSHKEKFWAYLDREVEEAAMEEKLLVIQMDSNAWLGDKIIPGETK